MPSAITHLTVTRPSTHLRTGMRTLLAAGMEQFTVLLTVENVFPGFKAEQTFRLYRRDHECDTITTVIRCENHLKIDFRTRSYKSYEKRKISRGPYVRNCSYDPRGVVVQQSAKISNTDT